MTEKERMEDKKALSLPVRIIIIFLICTADILVAAYFIYTWKQNGTVISVRYASDNIPGIFGQSLAVSMVAILVILIFFIILRKNFVSEMYLKISEKKQKITVLILVAILLAVTVFCLITKADKITILYNLLYYTVFIALEEELLVRGICVYLVKDENNYIRYLVPNILFAAMHLFSYANWGKITLVYVFSFITAQMLGLVLTGCIFQYLKEKSGTIWIPVLVHAILDYMVVLNY